MGEKLDSIKGFIGVSILTPIAGAAMSGASAIGHGLSSATQSLIGGAAALKSGEMLGVFKKK